MNNYEKLLHDNKVWAQEKTAGDPEYFKTLAKGQTPEFLWIGCSDSRVPAGTITKTQPGEIFVHRNIANLVIHTDINLLSVLEYSVMHLKVKHVIICGHYGCGGIKAAASNNDFKDVLNMWLRNIKDVYTLHSKELDAISDEEKRMDRLVELNVKEQLTHLANTSIIQKAWKQDQHPHLHGWVYSLKEGIINPLFDIAPNAKLENLYRYEDL